MMKVRAVESKVYGRGGREMDERKRTQTSGSSTDFMVP